MVSPTLFLLTRPSRGATVACHLPERPERISTHTPLAGRDLYPDAGLTPEIISTHTPLAGRDAATSYAMPVYSDFYSHAPRGARPVQSNFKGGTIISTHTPLAGRDSISIFRKKNWKISTHTPLAGRDRNRLHSRDMIRFLLTRPSRGATLTDACLQNANRYFYSHAPRGARRNNG